MRERSSSAFIAFMTSSPPLARGGHSGDARGRGRSAWDGVTRCPIVTTLRNSGNARSMSDSTPSRDDLVAMYLDTLPYDPYPVQEEALLAWFTNPQGVLVCAPTGT